MSKKNRIEDINEKQELISKINSGKVSKKELLKYLDEAIDEDYLSKGRPMDKLTACLVQLIKNV